MLYLLQRNLNEYLIKSLLLFTKSFFLFGAVFVLLMTVPLLYESLEDSVDTFAEKALNEIQKQYAVLDEKVLQKLKKRVISYKNSKQQ